MKEVKVLPFNHDSDDFWQAVNITSKELCEALIDFKKFNSFDLPKKLRILSVAIFAEIKAIMKNLNNGKNILPILFALICDSNKKESEIIELIEKNLIALEQFEENLNKLFSFISKVKIEC